MPQSNPPTVGALQGHWQRAWLRAPGVEDATTRVHWLQCGSIYADIRIPAARPSVEGARAIADLSNDAILALMEAEGFAGQITVADGICTWARRINWHGEPQTVDAGHMRFEPSGDLIEEGVHAAYTELWHPVPAARLRAAQGQSDDIEATLVEADDLFLLATGTPGLAASASAIEALRAGVRTEGLIEHFAHAYVFGHWDGAQGIADLATNPLIEGTPCLERHGNTVTWRVPDFHGRPRTGTLSHRA